MSFTDIWTRETYQKSSSITHFTNPTKTRINPRNIHSLDRPDTSSSSLIITKLHHSFTHRNFYTSFDNSLLTALPINIKEVKGTVYTIFRESIEDNLQSNVLMISCINTSHTKHKI